MHINGNTRPIPPLEGEVFHEEGRPEHTVKVVESSSDHITVEYTGVDNVGKGEEYEYGLSEFHEVYE